MAIEKRRLGKTDIEITPIGLGCWQFGGRSGLLTVWNTPPQEQIDQIVKRALDGGISWFDTAENYGLGASERALCQALGDAGKKAGDVVVATKWWPTNPRMYFPLPRTARSIPRTIGTRQSCLGSYPIDLFQIHFPWSISPIEAQMDQMAALVKGGKIRSVGVCNFSAPQMRRAHAALAKHGIPLASNQVSLSLARRKREKAGVIQVANELGVTVIAYSPLAQGLLTGRYHKDPESIKGLPLMRRTTVRRQLEATRPLINALDEIAQAHGRSAAEVALSWLVNFYGETVVAIPGATKASHVDQNVGALNLKLTPAEMKRLDDLSRGF